MTSKYSFIPVPLKHTSDVDLVKPLTSYIDTVYNTSDDNKPEIAEAVQVSHSSILSLFMYSWLLVVIPVLFLVLKAAAY